MAGNLESDEKPTCFEKHARGRQEFTTRKTQKNDL
jgi:hypothetical protein